MMRKSSAISRVAVFGLWLCLASSSVHAEDSSVQSPDFVRDVQPIFAAHCLKCHGGDQAEGGLRLTDAAAAMKELDSGQHAIVPRRADESELLIRVTSTDTAVRMPPEGAPLSAGKVETLRRWIDSGADWPQHWSLRPLESVPLPAIPADVPHGSWCRTEIDVFILNDLQKRGMTPAPEADKRTLLRRVCFDLTGLPPTPQQMEAFLADRSPQAFETVVDRLLASPRYGERWARHWIDIVHYADTHGHDEDAIREHAWPYRDYLIGAFNDDLPYRRFIQQQIAGDVLFPDDPRGVVATGMLAAGPWDESSQMGIQDGTVDKEIARYLDRDDMIATVMNTFVSLTVHCARCHDHKFDPISTEDYYSLQAVFAGVDRVDRAYDRDADVLKQRRELSEEQAKLAAGDFPEAALLNPAMFERVAAWEQDYRDQGGAWQIVEAASIESAGGSAAERLDDGSILFGGSRPETDVYTIKAHVRTQRITAVRLEVLTHPSLFQHGPGRQDNGNLHLSEFKLIADDNGRQVPVELCQPVADFNQQGWTIEHALDGNPKTAWGVYPQIGQSHEAVFKLKQPLEAAAGTTLTFVLEQLHGGGHLIGRPRLSVTGAKQPKAGTSVPAEIAEILAIDADQRNDPQWSRLALHVLKAENSAALVALPERAKVYSVASDFERKGNFVPATKPRPVHVLRRGNVLTPIEPAVPGALSCLPKLEPRFTLDDLEHEGARRAALARWVSADENVIVWRSIVNRVWHYHFGRGIAATCNDFGRNGSPPTHPELLDWLAGWFRDAGRGGGSLKKLHRLIVTSSVYRQSSRHQAEYAAVDRDNRFLWRMNRRRLDAESVRDAVLQISGRIDLTMGGPSVRQFVASGGVHVTPTVDYAGFDVDGPAARRRSVYRFVFRTVPDPFMDALDCPDASQFTPRRTTSMTSIQSLAMLNNRLVVRHCEHLAHRIEREHDDARSQVRRLFELAYGRWPTPAESELVKTYADKHGLANACRMLINSNEFMFVD